MPVDSATYLLKGGTPKAPPPTPPPVPSTIAENTAKSYRERRRGTGFSGTILGGARRPEDTSILGG